MNIEKKLEACQMCQRIWIIFFLKEFRKNSETIEQEQNTNLNSKEMISFEPFAFKGFSTNRI